MAPATDDADLPESDVSERHRIADGRIGQVVAGTYRIARYIGSGGSSHVFQAEHLRLGKAFAVKLLRAELDSSRRAAQRFRREAKAIARLNSEHIVSVIDCGELDDGTPYLVMELLEGEDLRSLLNREGTLPARRAVQIVIEACRGLTVVHGAGLVHRDLKPENLFIARRATGEDWCKVLDFGVAKMEASLTTAQGAIVGTVRYMAPEQLSDGASVGPTTDVYALGAILYECLSGKAPYDGTSVQELMYKIMNERAPELATELLPERLADIVSACLTRQPGSRPQSAAALASRLQECVQTRGAAVSFETVAEESQIPRAKGPATRRTSRGVAAALLAFALTAGLLGAISHFGHAGSLPDSDSPRSPLGASQEPIAQPQAESVAAMVVVPAPPESAAKQDVPPEPVRKSALIGAASSTPLKAAAPPAHTAAPRKYEPPSQGSAGGPAVGRFDQANPYAE